MIERDVTLASTMSKLGSSRQNIKHKLGVHALSGHANGSIEEKRIALREASRQFEAVFMNQMISAMRKTVGDGGILNKSNGESIFEGMLDEEWAKKLTNRTGPNSLSEMLFHQLSARLGLDKRSDETMNTRLQVKSNQETVPPGLTARQARDE